MRPTRKRRPADPLLPICLRCWSRAAIGHATVTIWGNPFHAQIPLCGICLAGMQTEGRVLSWSPLLQSS